MPLAPTFPNPSRVFDAFCGSVTNGPTGGVSVTAEPPPLGIPVDADGITVMQVYTLSDDSGLTWKNEPQDAQGKLPESCIGRAVGLHSLYGGKCMKGVTRDSRR
jgi:hypothetical protein